MKLDIIDIAFHRNGICGAPFHVVLFEDRGPEGSRKVAILFDEPHLRKALIDPPKTVRTVKLPADKPAIAVVSIRSGLVEEVRANHKLHVLVEDWDSTEVRPSHDPIVPERMLPGEEAQLTVFFQPATNQGD